MRLSFKLTYIKGEYLGFLAQQWKLEDPESNNNKNSQLLLGSGISFSISAVIPKGLNFAVLPKYTHFLQRLRLEHTSFQHSATD